MITNVGQQILTELKSEQTMDVTDKKWWFVFKDAGSIPHFLWHLLKAFSTALFVYPTAFLLFSVALLDEQGLQLLLSQSLSGFIHIRFQVIHLSLLFITLHLGYFTFQYWSRYVNIKQQYLSDNENFYQDQKLQIELIEEVLYRHKLIDRKDV